MSGTYVSNSNGFIDQSVSKSTEKLTSEPVERLIQYVLFKIYKCTITEQYEAALGRPPQLV